MESSSMAWGSRFQFPATPADAQLPEEYQQQQHNGCNDNNSGIWQYGDEASLYSIAEDSREDHVSVVSNGGALAAKDALQGNAWVFGSFWPQPAQQTDVVSRRDGPPPQNSGGSSHHSTPSAMGVELSITDDGARSFDTGDELFYYYHPGRRRKLCQRIGAVGLLCLVLCGLAIGSTFVVTGFRSRRSRQQGTSVESQTSASIEAGEGATSLANDEANDFMALAENFVFNALGSCPGSSTPQLLFDPSTYEGQVFAALVEEVNASAISDPATGSVILDPMHSVNYLQERFALEVLFHHTMGEDQWLEHDGWMNAGDPCDGWTGVDCAVPRSANPTECAVTGLYLDNNGLSGQLPAALCCLPCVQHIEMADNSIGGPVLTCLVQIPTLESIKFENNRFGTDPVSSTEATTTTTASTSVTLEARAIGEYP